MRWGQGRDCTGAVGVSGRVGAEEVAQMVGKSVTYKETENMSGCAEDAGRQAPLYCRRKWQLREGES